MSNVLFGELESAKLMHFYRMGVYFEHMADEMEKVGFPRRRESTYRERCDHMIAMQNRRVALDPKEDDAPPAPAKPEEPIVRRSFMRGQRVAFSEQEDLVIKALASAGVAVSKVEIVMAKLGLPQRSYPTYSKRAKALGFEFQDTRFWMKKQ